MRTPAKVALIGNSQAYLDARASVLRHFWLVETFALDLAQEPQEPCRECDTLQRSAAAGEMLVRQPADLFVLCASIEEPQRQVWVERVRTEHPEALIIRLNGFDSGPKAGADATVSDTRGPGALVSAIYELLTERGLESRAWPEAQEDGWVQ